MKRKQSGNETQVAFFVVNVYLYVYLYRKKLCTKNWENARYTAILEENRRV